MSNPLSYVAMLNLRSHAREQTPEGIPIMIAEDQIINLVVIDKDPIFALGLCSLLEKRPDVRASAFGPADLLEFGQDHHSDGLMQPQVDIALLDPAQVDLTAGQLAKRLRERFGARSLISYTNDLSHDAGRASLAAGFRGVLPRSDRLRAT